MGALNAEQLELAVVQLMAHTRARQKLGLHARYDDWEFISQAAIAVDADLARHDGISDDDTAIVKDLQRRAKLLAEAVAWMLDKSLAPEPAEESDD